MKQTTTTEKPFDTQFNVAFTHFIICLILFVFISIHLLFFSSLCLIKQEKRLNEPKKKQIFVSSVHVIRLLFRRRSRRSNGIFK